MTQAEPSLMCGAAARRAMASLDEVDLESEFTTRACVMKTPPVFLRGMYRSAMRFALTEADRGREAGDMLMLSRAWKLFLLLPRLLLRRPARGGNVPKSRLHERFADFADGRWASLLEQRVAVARTRLHPRQAVAVDGAKATTFNGVQTALRFWSLTSVASTANWHPRQTTEGRQRPPLTCDRRWRLELAGPHLESTRWR